MMSWNEGFSATTHTFLSVQIWVLYKDRRKNLSMSTKHFPPLSVPLCFPKRKPSRWVQSISSNTCHFSTLWLCNSNGAVTVIYWWKAETWNNKWILVHCDGYLQGLDNGETTTKASKKPEKNKLVGLIHCPYKNRVLYSFH